MWRSRVTGAIAVRISSASFTQLKQRGRLKPTRLLLPGQVVRLARMLPSFLEASSEEINRAELPGVLRLEVQRTSSERGSERLLQEREALLDASSVSIGFTQCPRDDF